MIALTANAALELAPTVRANCVAAGMIDTPLTAMITSNPEWKAAAESGTPLGRLGTAREVADVIVFLVVAGGRLHHRPDDRDRRRQRAPQPPVRRPAPGDI